MTGNIPRLQLDALTKNFGETQAVRGMDLALAPGEFVSLLGPSGCGKSTTLAIIAGFEAPTSGDVKVDGVRINDLSPGKRRIGLVFQDYAVFSRLTVASNLSFGLEAQRVPRRDRKGRVDAVAAQLGLTDIMHRRGGSLNMSEMQRVALARVLVTEPKLLLLDEPMSNLDAALRMSLRSELKLLQKQLQQTVLYVTHDQVEAMAMSDRIAVMHNGVIEQIGSPDEIYHQPATRFVAEFIGDPPMNVIPCDVRRDGAEVSVSTALHGAIPIGQMDVDEGEYLLGIRPHDLFIRFDDRLDVNNGHDVETVVQLVENHGAEHIVYCSFGEGVIGVAVPPGPVKVGDKVRLALDADRLHLIQPSTGRVMPRAAYPKADVLRRATS